MSTRAGFPFCSRSNRRIDQDNLKDPALFSLDERLLRIYTHYWFINDCRREQDSQTHRVHELSLQALYDLRDVSEVRVFRGRKSFQRLFVQNI